MRFRSGFEEKVWKSLKKRRKKAEYETKKIPYQISAFYVPDIILPNGVLVELKGVLSASDRKKMVAVKRCNPSLDIRLVFQRANNRLTKSKNSRTYWQWAETNGFPWADGDIPTEWWNE